MHFPLIITSAAALLLVSSFTGASEPGAGLLSLRQYIPPGGPIDGTTTPLPNDAAEEVNDECKRRFNQYRALHGSKDIVYNSSLQDTANQCAEYYMTEKTASTLGPDADIFQLSLVQKCKQDVGERGHHFGITDDEPILSDVPYFVSRFWYREKDGLTGSTPPVPAYNYAAPDRDSLKYFTDFTAMIWNSTTSFACAVSSTATPGTNTRFLSVIYEPIGNVIPDDNLETYVQNVGEPTS